MNQTDTKTATDISQIQIENQSQKKGLKFERHFTKAGVHPFDEIEWEQRTALISNEKGEKVFEQKNVEIPKFWSMTATNVVVSKYFHGKIGTPKRESSVRQLVDRVARAATKWGREGNYFATDEDERTFYDELSYLMVNQYMAFNSPVWFNVGIEERPQCSACFINSVEDNMESILTLAKTEGMLFKWGSGTGSNLSTLRSSRETLSGGGTASGPVSFMRGYDAFAGVIKSGGKTRRAAKMVILNADHPDIVEFINCKAKEEKKAWVLIDAGYDGGFNVVGGAYDSIDYQNANHSVRVTDDFMKAVLEDKDWSTKAVHDGRIVDNYKARDILKQIAEATWICGDPGMQYDTQINNWHTSSNTSRINSSNPCSEYMYLDDSACNLASLNLMKFVRENGDFNVEAFIHAVSVTTSAMEIWVDNASYPTPRIAKNSHEFRPLGLGYANLGALLMTNGLAYDSEAGRDYAAAITSIMCGQAYKQSAFIAGEIGTFKGYEINKEPMMNVMMKHRLYAERISNTFVPLSMTEASTQIWNDVVELGKQFGFRNGQTTVLAPTGTIGFMMDCDTTGVEPDIALVKYKKLVGGGFMKLVNNSVQKALEELNYNQEQIENILSYIEKNETIEGAPFLREEHLSIFDCAFKASRGNRSIHYMGHIKMMSAVQPFLSGAISKTVNLPNEASVDEIMQVYIEGWKLGLKAIAVYRDGCKRTQPLSTSMDDDKKEIKKENKKSSSKNILRRHLPTERQSYTHKFSIAGHEGYITVGMYEDGQPGEVFITMSKEGSTISGLMDAFATSISLALQYGVPLKILVNKFSHMRFEPSGFTNNENIPIAKSICDYIFRWLGLKFLPKDEQPSSIVAETAALISAQESENKKSQTETNERLIFQTQSDAPPCHECGSIMIRSGSCYKCLDCGSTSGCS